MRPFFVSSPPKLTLRLLTLAGPLMLSACAFPGWRSAPDLKGKYPGGGRHYHVARDHLGDKHGEERWWHEEGTLRSEATWIRGRRDGVYRAWHPDGTPWYEGRDSLGVPVDTVRVWHPNGQLQSLSVYEGGETVSLATWDSAGYTPAERAQVNIEEAARLQARSQADSVEAVQSARTAALAEWVPRVRTTVETYWKVPESMKNTPRRAVARLRVSPHGSLLDVTWIEKSGSAEFDRRAAQALTKVRKFPPPPSELGTEPLTLRYEFTTAGVGGAKQRLQVREKLIGN